MKGDRSISLNAAIDAVHKNYDTILDFKSDGKTIAYSIEDILSGLPPAQPERKKGHWERLKCDEGGWFYQCSNCKTEPLRDKWTKREMLSDWCPWCGADMRDDDHD